MDQFSIIDKILLYLSPDDYINCLHVNSLWYSVVLTKIRKLFSWTKSDLIIQSLSKKKQHERCFLTPAVFCKERGIEFIIDMDESLLILKSAYGNSYSLKIQVALGVVAHVKYTTVARVLIA